ncbi:MULTISPECIES: NADH-quinone oxidoreductase subunit NuoG [Thiorhodovibrio]|uniref:NADH-quinone oxidoreductase subunit NuoG n=1 Tax=Thiorhodovibrio TaxID=61593 RepID=UPI00191337D6|nr:MULTISPECIES: NADH-quinone oxidoreductase subunit NuoG [Thiorhodovibrio]MBK5970129.1 NADH-quinone oxidoreductase subunit G [Thiorhodovibrio winogradskyi]WPL13513.1 NADH-quinone oxidoreductase chain 3 [Thiorhodovibrio litoralis]
MSEKITLEIDGRSCEATPGEMIIAVADREGIAIPRFCYHPKLSIAANCRMCLVEAEQGGRAFPKPVPACATPVGDGMKVLTRSHKALEAQRGTMEFLLINHPLDCPICDQGGECELQDVSMGYGEDVSRFSERKRVVQDEDLGPLIATEMTRCIHCTRCVRFGAEIAGVRELGATGRGEDMRIGTFVAHTVSHELSGNIIDLCPVGALTSKPYRFTARAWELTDRDSISPHDSVGANLHLHVRGQKVMRVHPRANEAVNETWISDRDRFGYQGLNSDARLERPLVKRDGSWHEIDWESALKLAVDGLRAIDADSIGCLVSPQATLEEQHLLQKLLRGLGSGHIDSRLRQQDFRGDASDPLRPWLGLAIAELEQQQTIVLIGSDIRAEQPLLAHRIRKAALKGARVAAFNYYHQELTHPSRQFVAPPGCLLVELAALAKALDLRGASAVQEVIGMAEPEDRHRELAEQLRAAHSSASSTSDANAHLSGAVLLLGALAAADPDYALIKALAETITSGCGAKLGYLPAANATASALAGALPHVGPGGMALAESGLNAREMLVTPRQAYVLWDLDPSVDLIDLALARQALSSAQLVIACSPFLTPALEQYANLLLPIGAFTETAGTFINAGGLWQRFQGAVAPPGDARPGWKVLRVLGNLLELDGFGYNSAREISNELETLCKDAGFDNAARAQRAGLDVPKIGQTLMRVGSVPIYASDSIVRHAPALQHTPLAESLSVGLHPEQVEKLGLADGDKVTIRQGDATATAKVSVTDAVPPGCARIPAAVPGSETLGAQIGPVSLNS